MKEKITKRGSGGALLLATKGPDYFKKLGQKSAEKRAKALSLWNKTQAKKKKSVSSAKGRAM